MLKRRDANSGAENPEFGEGGFYQNVGHASCIALITFAGRFDVKPMASRSPNDGFMFSTFDATT